eukprot:4242794-Amphidinium_carterae.1
MALNVQYSINLAKRLAQPDLHFTWTLNPCSIMNTTTSNQHCMEGLTSLLPFDALLAGEVRSAQSSRTDA